MAYGLSLTPRFERSFRKLDHSVARRILAALYELCELDDPTVRLRPLRLELAGFWRLRVGDHRVVLDVRPEGAVMIALDVGHRRGIYH